MWPFNNSSCKHPYWSELSRTITPPQEPIVNVPALESLATRVFGVTVITFKCNDCPKERTFTTVGTPKVR